MFWNVGLLLGAFILMEFLAWWMHKYLMHGPLWVLHESHHRPRQGWFEKNDLFGIFFSGLSMLLFWYGTHGVPALLWIAIGVTLYGAAYFLFHDVIVHQRVRWRRAWTQPYLRRLIRAHLIHHKTTTREGCVCFSFLWAPSPESLVESSRAREAAS